MVGVKPASNDLTGECQDAFIRARGHLLDPPDPWTEYTADGSMELWEFDGDADRELNARTDLTGLLFLPFGTSTKLGHLMGLMVRRKESDDDGDALYERVGVLMISRGIWLTTAGGAGDSETDVPALGAGQGGTCSARKMNQPQEPEQGEEPVDDADIMGSSLSVYEHSLPPGYGDVNWKWFDEDSPRVEVILK